MSKNIYFLTYRAKRRKPELLLKVIGGTSMNLIAIRGEKASKIFRTVFSILNAYGIKYSVTRGTSEDIYELPADVGHAILLFMLMTYSAKYPERYSVFLEKLLAGKIPLTIHLKAFLDMAIELSELVSREKSRRTIIYGHVARTLSPIMRNLAKVLSRYGA